MVSSWLLETFPSGLPEFAVPVSYSVDAMSDALVNELAREIIVFVPVITALEFAVPIPLAEFGC